MLLLNCHEQDVGFEGSVGPIKLTIMVIKSMQEAEVGFSLFLFFFISCFFQYRRIFVGVYMCCTYMYSRRSAMRTTCDVSQKSESCSF